MDGGDGGGGGEKISMRYQCELVWKSDIAIKQQQQLKLKGELLLLEKSLKSFKEKHCLLLFDVCLLLSFYTAVRVSSCRQRRQINPCRL
jgi:hypothetical protein